MCKLQLETLRHHGVVLELADQALDEFAGQIQVCL